MIPRLIHFIWIGGAPLPDWCAWNIDEFRRLNPDHAIKIHDESSLPDEWRETYDRAPWMCTKSDVLRYAIMYRFGGWYFDTDYLPFRPVADAERAFDLDGSKVFACRVYEDDRPSSHNGAVLAAAPGNPAFLRMLDHCRGVKEIGRLSFGPIAVKHDCSAHPRDYVIAGPHHFNGVRHPASTRLFHHVQDGGSLAPAMRADPRTGGALPFAMHLWAHSASEHLAERKTAKSMGRWGTGRPFAVVLCGLPSPKPDTPYQHIAEGLAACGYTVEMHLLEPDALDKSTRIPSLVVIWGGDRERPLAVRQRAEEMGCAILRMEHGFYDRGAYSQCDHAGVLHNASWASLVASDPPPAYRTRLDAIRPQRAPVRARDAGNILILGQVNGDAQMIGAPIAGMAPLVREMSRAKVGDVPRVFRPHPTTALGPKTWRPWPNIKERKLDHSEGVAYGAGRQFHGVSLAQDLAQARFCVAINSNALVEATLAGIPCAAFGPSLGLNAGVYHRLTLATLNEDLAEMIKGWQPNPEAVERYLAWLAGRQWSCEEFRQPEILLPILRDAGVQI